VNVLVNKLSVSPAGSSGGMLVEASDVVKDGVKDGDGVSMAGGGAASVGAEAAMPVRPVIARAVHAGSEEDSPAINI